MWDPGTNLIGANCSVTSLKYVNILTNINDYTKLEKELKKNKGETSFSFKKNLAKKAYKLIYEYDSQINKWFNKNRTIVFFPTFTIP